MLLCKSPRNEGGRKLSPTVSSPQRLSTSLKSVTKRFGVGGAVLLMLVFFLIANRGAYKGYFQDDDLDNAALARMLNFGKSYVEPLLIPQYFRYNFRPLGSLYYRIMGATAEMHYQAYVAAIQAIHLIAALLVWLVLRRLALPRVACWAGCLFFVFHMAVFDVLWKPMYVFDLLCGTFCLASLLAWLHGRWILSLIMFWLAFRSKETAIAFPVLLLAYEWIAGRRKWKPLIPFFAISIYMGLRGILWNRSSGEAAYTLQLNPTSFWTCLNFYAGKPFLLPAGLGAAALILILLFLIPNKVVRFGITGFWIMLALMLLLPGRLFDAYLYVPLIGLAIAFAGLASRLRPGLIALFFAIWLPLNYIQLRRDRRAFLADAPDRRAFTAGLQQLSRDHPEINTFIYEAGPLNDYGSQGALRLVRSPRAAAALHVSARQDPQYESALHVQPLAVIGWDAPAHRPRFVLRKPGALDAAYIQMSDWAPVWQLEKGWYSSEGGFRWIEPEAVAKLTRPPGALQFALTVNMGRELQSAIKHSHVSVALNGTLAGECDFTEPGWHTVKWKLPPGPSGETEVKIRASPALSSAQGPLGIAIVGFGFVSGAS